MLKVHGEKLFKLLINTLSKLFIIQLLCSTAEQQDCDENINTKTKTGLEGLA